MSLTKMQKEFGELHLKNQNLESAIRQLKGELADANYAAKEGRAYRDEAIWLRSLIEKFSMEKSK